MDTDVSIPDNEVQLDKPAGAPAQAEIPDSEVQLDSDKYSTPGQQVLTGLEGFGRGLTLGTSDLLAKPLRSLGEYVGINPDIMAPKPEEMAARQTKNPLLSKASKATAMIGGAVAGAGAPGLVGGFAKGLVGEAATTAAGKIGAAALTGAIENGLFQGGDEISEAMLGKGDPETPVASALADMGYAGLVGGALGGVFGTAAVGLSKIGATKAAQAASKSIEDLGARMQVPSDAEAAVATDIAKKLPNLKSNVGEIADAADRLGLPLMNGMTSGDKAVQATEDLLLHGPPTIPAVQRQALYSKGYNGAVSAIDDVIPDVALSKNEVGQNIATGLLSKIKSEAEPFNDLYSEIKEVTPEIPLSDRSGPAIARNIRDIEGVKAAFKSPAATLARDIADEIEGGDITNVEQLRNYQTELRNRISPTSSASEKRIISIVSDKLDTWERKAINDHADSFVNDIQNRTDMSPADKNKIWGDKVDRIQNLQGQIDAADKQYAPFKQKISELSSWLGKERIGGAKDAMSFIQDRLEPEDLINKLSSKKYAGLGNFMQKNFPEEYELVRQYEKSQLRQAASTGKQFNATTLLKNYSALPKEYKSSIFTPAENQKLGDIKTYLNAMPPNFNPSGTSHMTAYRAFFESLKGAALGNVRDLAIRKFIGKDMSPEFIRNIGRPVSDAGAATAMKVMSSGDTEGLWPMLDYTSVAERGAKKINTGVGNLFKSAGQQAVDVYANERNRDKIKKHIESGQMEKDLQQEANRPTGTLNNLKGFAKGGEVNADPEPSPSPSPAAKNYLAQHAPAQNMMIQSSRTRINNYLNSLRPMQDMNKLPFDQDHHDPQKARGYDKAIDLANQPLSILNHVKDGSLTPEQMTHFTSMYPELYNHLSKTITEHVTKAQLAKEQPAYQTRQAMAMFLNAPLDASMTPQSIMAAQGVYASQRANMPQAAAPQQTKKGTSSLSKVAGSYKTPGQAAEGRQQTDH